MSDEGHTEPQLDRMVAQFLGESRTVDTTDPATAERVLDLMKILVWQCTIAEWPDRWHVEVWNKEGLSVGEGGSRLEAICVAAVRAGGLLR